MPLNGLSDPFTIELPPGLELSVRPSCCYPSDDASLAETAYCAYNAGGPSDRAGLNYQGIPCPVWGELPPVVREKWECAVSGALTAARAALVRQLATMLGATTDETQADTWDRLDDLLSLHRSMLVEPRILFRLLLSKEQRPGRRAALEAALECLHSTRPPPALWALLGLDDSATDDDVRSGVEALVLQRNALRGDPAAAVRAALAQGCDGDRETRLRAALQLLTETEQPPPTPGYGDCWGDFIASELERDDVCLPLVVDARARRALGIERYGQPLTYAGDDGRSRSRDTTEEGLDLLIYAFSERDDETVEAARAVLVRRYALEGT